MTMLRSTLALLSSVCAIACGVVVEDLPATDESSGTAAADDSSTSAGESAMSTTGRPPATSSSTTVDALTTGASDETGTVFLIVPDGGGGCLLTGEFEARCSLCDLAAQDCPDGEKCVPWANDGGDVWNSQRCAPVPENPAGFGEPCVAEGSPVSGIDDCDVGALCWGVDPRTLQGTCAPLCDPSQLESCADAEVCAAYDDFAPYVCVPRCDPFDQAACPADAACRAIADDTVCVPLVTLPQGLECGLEGQFCAADQACRWADELASCDDPQCCRPWCDLSAPAPDLPCAAVPGELCRPFSAAPPVGLEHVGVCGLPL